MVHQSILRVGTLLLLTSTSAVLADPSYGCSSLIPKPVEWNPQPGEIKLFKVNDRNVRVTVPDTYNSSIPTSMIVGFHDRDQPVEHFEFEAGFKDDRTNNTSIMVYPEAQHGRWTSDITPLKKGEKRSQFANDTVDIQFTHALVRDLENLMCVDTSRIYALGLGVGGGMMHMLACDPTMSASFAAVAAVGGIFGKSKEGKRPWGVCKPARQVPIVEIHGLDDRIAGYVLRENENGKRRMIPKHWIEEWTERNGCGGEDGETEQSTEEPATFITKLEHGSMTESIQFGGAVRRIARSCLPKPKEADSKTAEPEDEEDLVAATEDETNILPKPDIKLPTVALHDSNSTVLHYTLSGYSHGWPRQHLKRQQYVQFQDKHFALADESDTFFDTTKIIFEYFAAHTLEEQFAKRNPVQEGEEAMGGGGPVSEEEMAKKMKEQYGLEHAELGKEKTKESEMEKKMRQFKEAQEKIQKGTGEGEKEKDEL